MEDKIFDMLEDNKYLEAKEREEYSRSLAYRYLVRAAKVLKNNNYDKERRYKVLYYLDRYLYKGLPTIIKNEENIKITESRVERIVAFCMDSVFHKLVVLEAANLGDSLCERLVTLFFNDLYDQELEYIKINTSFKASSYIALEYANQRYKDTLKGFTEAGLISQEEYEKAMYKSYIHYLDDVIKELKEKPENINLVRQVFIKLVIFVFIVICIIIALCVYFFSQPTKSLY